MTLLHCACQNKDDNINLVEYLISLDKIDINAKDVFLNKVFQYKNSKYYKIHFVL